jgi:hypothetical protein
MIIYQKMVIFFSKFKPSSNPNLDEIFISILKSSIRFVFEKLFVFFFAVHEFCPCTRFVELWVSKL